MLLPPKYVMRRAWDVVQTNWVLAVLVFLNALVIVHYIAVNANPCPSSPSPSTSTSSRTLSPPRPPTLVVYAHHESDELRTANLDFFVKNGICDHCTNVDYVFVLNGNTTYQDKFPNRKNVLVLPRENQCGDFAAWDHALAHKGVNTTKYKRFMFLNDTVRGPFIDPHYRLLMDEDFHFTDIFGAHLSNQTKIFGSYVNCEISPHVQSMAWMTDDVGLNLIRSRIKCIEDKAERISQGEVGISRELLSKGYNIGGMLYAYIGRDFRTSGNSCNENRNPTYAGKYFQQNVSLTEVVFFKNTIDSVPNIGIQELYTNWLTKMHKNNIKV